MKRSEAIETLEAQIDNEWPSDYWSGKIGSPEYNEEEESVKGWNAGLTYAIEVVEKITELD